MTIRVGSRESSKTSDVEIRASSERAGTVDGAVPAVVVGTLGGGGIWVYIPRMFLGWWVEWIVVDRVGKDIREYYNNMYTPLEL